MEKRFKTNVRKDLEKHEEEIKFILENEIVSRRHFQKGRVEASLVNDPYIKKAETILTENSKYFQLLGF